MSLCAGHWCYVTVAARNFPSNPPTQCEARVPGRFLGRIVLDVTSLILRGTHCQQKLIEFLLPVSVCPYPSCCGSVA